MIDGIIIGFVVGIFGGMILMAAVNLKDFDKIWNETYELGIEHGKELEKYGIKKNNYPIHEPPKEDKNNKIEGYTGKQININSYDEIHTARVPLKPLTYAAKTFIRQSTIDVFGLENVVSVAKKELAEKITNEVFKTTNLVKYEQEKDNNENITITARLTVYAEENK